mgnify:CR=1 FL=1
MQLDLTGTYWNKPMSDIGLLESVSISVTSFASSGTGILRGKAAAK